MTAPQRAQRVRGVPGVGLRTPDGTEWLRWGRGHRWNPDTITPIPPEPGWVVARCAHDTGEFMRLPDDDLNRIELGLQWDICSDCRDIEMATFTVQSCTRPGRYGNPSKINIVRSNDLWSVWADSAGFPNVEYVNGTRADAMAVGRVLVVDEFAIDYAYRWPDYYFDVLAQYDYLSCWCGFGDPCHVDEIIREGSRREVWS